MVLGFVLPGISTLLCLHGLGTNVLLDIGGTATMRLAGEMTSTGTLPHGSELSLLVFGKQGQFQNIKEISCMLCQHETGSLKDKMKPHDL
jgi:hypothetical protein